MSTRYKQSETKFDATMRLWTHSQASKAIPYIRSVTRSLREYWLKMRRARLQTERIDNVFSERATAQLRDLGVDARAGRKLLQRIDHRDVRLLLVDARRRQALVNRHRPADKERGGYQQKHRHANDQPRIAAYEVEQAACSAASRLSTVQLTHAQFCTITAIATLTSPDTNAATSGLLRAAQLRSGTYS